MKSGQSLLAQLTAEQKQVYNNIKKCINKNEGEVVVLEALPGTGKSFVLSILARNYNVTVDYVVFRKDQASLLTLDKIGSYTYLSYSMRHFHLQYRNAIRMSQMSYKSNIDVLYKIIQCSLKYTTITEKSTVKTIIVDSYTVCSPIMLLLLYVISIRYGINLIFSGSKMHMGAIHKSGLHSRNNFYIAKILSNLTITSLTTNMRIRDENFKNKLLNFSEAIKCYEPEGDVKFYFNLRYKLYCLFQSKYFTEESFETLYMSQYHYDITTRLYRFINHLKSNNIVYFIEPYQYWDGMNYVTITMEKKQNKFVSGLILVTGYKYVYITRQGLHKIVILEQVIFKNNMVDAVLVRFLEDDHEEQLRRVCLNYYQVSPAYRTWLLQSLKNVDDVTLFHFPLRLYTLTFHSALGMTIENEMVEINADSNYLTSTANSIFAGLSSVTNESDIHKIHAYRDLSSFVVTNYIEVEHSDDTYYYSCPDYDENRDLILKYVSTNRYNAYIEKIEWVTTESIVEFENNRIDYLRIDRSKYQQNKKKEKNTSLMKITQFMKQNRNVILKIIDEVRKENTAIRKENKALKNINESKIKPNFKDFKSYIHLEEAYINWEGAKEGNKKKSSK